MPDKLYGIEMLKTLIILLFLSLAANAALAEMYKWVDDEGNVHYGDRPPVKNEFEKMKPPPAADEKEAMRLQQRTKNILQQQMQVDADRAREKQASRKPDAQKVSIEKRCKRDRAELVFYKKSGKHSILDQDGNLTRVKSSERKQKITELESFIAQNCQ